VSLSHIDFSRQLLNLVPVETAQKYGVLPIYVRRGKNKEQTLYVAMEDPTEAEALDEISRHSGLPVRGMIAPPSDIRGAIRAYYLGLPPEDEPLPPPPPVPQVMREKAPSPPPAPRAEEVDAEAVPDSEVPSRDSRIPKPKVRKGDIVVVTLLDGTQIALPKRKPKEERGAGDGLTAMDLVEALRAHAKGADVSGVLGDEAKWELLFSALLSLMMKKHLIHDWEFVRELKK
jgi:type IV pilus assembly protein PilB